MTGADLDAAETIFFKREGSGECIPDDETNTDHIVMTAAIAAGTATMTDVDDSDR